MNHSRARHHQTSCRSVQVKGGRTEREGREERQRWRVERRDGEGGWRGETEREGREERRKERVERREGGEERKGKAQRKDENKVEKRKGGNKRREKERGGSWRYVWRCKSSQVGDEQ